MIELLATLAVWKLSIMLMSFDGPLDIIKWPRDKFQAFQKRIGKRFLAFDCIVCFSQVIALPFAVLLTHSLGGFIIYWLALSGGATLIHATWEALSDV